MVKFFIKFFLFVFLLADFVSSSAKQKTIVLSSIAISSNKKAENKNKLSRDFFNQAAQTLKEKQKNLNKVNFPYVLEKHVCKVLDEAKRKDISYVSEISQKLFLQEVVQTYDKILEYSLDHNYFYCLYYYFEEEKPKLIMELAKDYLDKEKRGLFLDRLKTCYETETRDQGIPPMEHLNVSQKRPSLTPLSLREYMQLSKTDRLKISNSLRRALLALEKYQDNLLVAKLSPIDFLIPKAFAESRNQCIIGGVLKEKIYSSQINRTVCSARNNSCNGRSNTFQCGVLFKSVCIPLHSIKNISKRCYQASQNKALSRSTYNQFLITENPAYHEYCSERQERNNGRAGAGCNFYFKVIEDLKKRYSESDDETDSQIPGDPHTEVGFCDDCLTRENTEQNENLKSIEDIVELSQKDSELVKYLSDQIYSNSQCRCGVNDACTRGCKRDEYPPKLDCRGKRDRYKSTKYCMRHVNGALVDTIDAFLKQYCGGNNFDRRQCLKIHNRGLTDAKSICTKSFVLPSALCALNLDGKDRYGYIPYRNIKNECKDLENSNNQYLKKIRVISDDGQSVEDIPLFEEIPLPEDPDDLPTGAIVVMNSGSIYGHVEIKTNKNNCDGKPCFCSDFCTSRSGGYNFPNKPRVAFRWHPRLLDYFGDQ